MHQLHRSKGVGSASTTDLWEAGRADERAESGMTPTWAVRDRTVLGIGADSAPQHSERAKQAAS